MKDPLVPLARWANSIMGRWGSLVGDKVITLVTVPIFAASWIGLYLAFKAIAPNAGTTRWLGANWPVIVAGTVILFAVYWFVRNFFDAKTGR
jgi:hypothetical protein